MQGFLQELCDHIAIPSVLDDSENSLLNSHVENQKLEQQAIFHTQSCTNTVQPPSLYTTQLQHPFALASDGLFVPATQLQTYEYLLNCNLLVSSIQNPTNSSDNIPPSPTHSHLSASSSPPPSSSYPSYMYAPSPDYSTSPILSPDSTTASLQFYTANSGQIHANAPLSDPLKIQCINCGTFETSVWRKNSVGQSICNACGLYKKQRGIDRPAAFPFRKAVVRRRKRGKKAVFDADGVVEAVASNLDESPTGSRWLDDLI
ncbi:putative electron transfer flavoprotein subunit [Physocladia obscura]|uniref:Electron transfer flavoprotein subunit n=1 Tax=Physocladia obscura TaxID=109957 RepID=A0AAD5T0K1_9FUNG|nr:putative electron transfer flavoprotein subunit [Physocladia obscura]